MNYCLNSLGKADVNIECDMPKGTEVWRCFFPKNDLFPIKLVFFRSQMKTLIGDKSMKLVDTKFGSFIAIVNI